MPILRSREVVFEASTAKTLEKEPPLDPSTPSKSDAMLEPDSSSTPSPSSAAAPRRRSLRLASVSTPITETVSSRKRKPRVSQSPSVREVRVLRESGSMNLRSGTRITKRQATVEKEKEVGVDLQAKMGFEAIVVEKLKSAGEPQSEENGVGMESAIESVSLERLNYETKGKGKGKGKLVCDAVCCEKAEDDEMVIEEENVKGKLVAEEEGSSIDKDEVEKEKDKEVQEKLDFEATIVEERLKSVGESQLLESVTVMSKVEGIEAVGANLGHVAKGKGKLVSDTVFPEKARDEMIIDNEEKGKGKLVVEEDHPMIERDEVIFERKVGEGSKECRRGRKAKKRRTMESRKETERNKAIELAPKYAFFKAEEEVNEEEEEDEDLVPTADQEEDWPGPFSTAMKIIRDREQILMTRELNSSSKKNDDNGIKIQWSPAKVPRFKPLGKSAPSLHDLSMKILCENAEEIESLDGVPDVLKHQIVSHLCRSRKMGSGMLGHLVRGSPTEIHLTDCSWASEGTFEDAFEGCNTENLKVVELDISGRCLPDYVLRGILARSPNNLPLLTKISLRGNYRLSDDGLNAIVASAPMLSSVNLSQCSLITSSGIIDLANNLESVLRELYIDECQDVDAMLILPALVRIKNLEILSVAGIETVNNKFVKKMVSVCGSTLKGLVFSGCRKLTAASMKVIGESCSQLCSLDIWNLNRLNDSAIAHLANGCRSIQKLKLGRNAFSDEAVAAFVEAAGGSLNELSLNNVQKVAQQTAIAISRRCSSSLKILDLSFCRNMSDEALGLIVDSCSSLRILKLFGCTQVTNVFLEGHSNSSIKIVGSKGPVLDQIELPGFL